MESHRFKHLHMLHTGVSLVNLGLLYQYTEIYGKSWRVFREVKRTQRSKQLYEDIFFHVY